MVGEIDIGFFVWFRSMENNWTCNIKTFK